jgi:hypothetical protein
MRIACPAELAPHLAARANDRMRRNSAAISPRRAIASAL